MENTTLRYRKTDDNHPANIPPGTPRFSSSQGVCDFCYGMLLKENDHAYLIHYNTLWALYTSSLTCPCCSVLFQCFHESPAEIEEALQRAQVSPLGVGSSQEIDLGITYTTINDEFRSISLIVYRPAQPNNEDLIYGQLLYFCTSEAQISKQQIWCSKSSNIPLSLRKSVIHEWVDDCKESHTSCKEITEPPILPTRVLDLGRIHSGDPVRLFESGGLRAQYAALSHCWGKLQLLSATADTLHEHKQGIDYSVLPKTFRDAVEVSRDLGIRYLWMNSLCIIQDNLKDWESESAHMASVYQNAYLTISAAASSDSSGGLHWPCKPSLQFDYDGNKTAYFRREENTHNTVTESPLGKRAWVLQETILSRRVIHFAEDQLYWACTAKHASEDGLVALPASYEMREKKIGSHPSGRRYPSITSALPTFRSTKRSPKGELYQTWHDISQAYNLLEITKLSDKVARLAGITSVMEELLDDSPFLGLWLQNLQEDLLWIRAPRQTSSHVYDSHNTILNLPSWSWLSTDQTQYFPTITYMIKKGPLSNCLEVIRTSILWSGQPLTSHVVSSELTVRGTLINLRSYDNTEFWGSPYKGNMAVGIHASTSLEGTVHMDHVMKRDEEVNRDLKGLEVAWYRRDANEEHPPYHCEILILESDGEGGFIRVGAARLQIWGEAANPKLYRHPFMDSEKVTISLR